MKYRIIHILSNALVIFKEDTRPGLERHIAYFMDPWYDYSQKATCIETSGTEIIETSDIAVIFDVYCALERFTESMIYNHGNRFTLDEFELVEIE
jgi:hypothetical protein